MVIGGSDVTLGAGMVERKSEVTVVTVGILLNTAFATWAGSHGVRKRWEDRITW